MPKPLTVEKGESSERKEENASTRLGRVLQKYN